MRRTSRPGPPGRGAKGRAGDRTGTRRARTAALRELALEIQACRRCPLGFSRTQAVVYRGSLAPEVVFVGEAPGAEEDRRGVPFVGRSGAVLDRAVEELGTALGPYGVLNVLKCRPPDNRFLPEAARACRPFLERQLRLLRPRRLVPLGARALRALAPEAPPILQAAGRPVRSDLGPVFPLLHPAATLRAKRHAERWARDLLALRTWLLAPLR